MVIIYFFKFVIVCVSYQDMTVLQHSNFAKKKKKACLTHALHFGSSCCGHGETIRQEPQVLQFII